MFPMTDLDLDEEASHYMPEERLESWEEYDEKVMVSTDDKLIYTQPIGSCIFTFEFYCLL